MIGFHARLVGMTRINIVACAAVGIGAMFALAGCTTDHLDAPIAFNAAELAVIATLSPVPSPPPDPSNAQADNPLAAALGQALFFDKALSKTGEVACSTCHQPDRFFADGEPLGKGVGTAGRNTPTALGAAHARWLFWDGRADSLWMQALGPVESDVEHGFTRLGVAHALADRYRSRYEAVFGALGDLSDPKRFPTRARPVPDDPAHPDAVAWAAMTVADRAVVDRLFANFGKAIAAYERRLLPGEAPIDRYVAAVKEGDASGGGALTEAQRRGLRIFVGEHARCAACHAGPRMTRDVFFNIGVAQPPGAAPIDQGRRAGARDVLLSDFNCAGPHSDQDAASCAHLIHLKQGEVAAIGAFKVPTLRNVEHTAPYMHAGQLATLHDVIDHYDTIEAHAPAAGTREPFLRDLALSDRDRDDLVALLRAFSGLPPTGPLMRAP